MEARIGRDAGRRPSSFVAFMPEFFICRAIGRFATLVHAIQTSPTAGLNRADLGPGSHWKIGWSVAWLNSRSINVHRPFP